MKKDLFSEVDDDEEDLFKPQASDDVDVDDITKYIEQNIGQTTFDKVDLFSWRLINNHLLHDDMCCA